MSPQHIEQHIEKMLQKSEGKMGKSVKLWYVPIRPEHPKYYTHIEVYDLEGAEIPNKMDQEEIDKLKDEDKIDPIEPMKPMGPNV
jgi:hypothetical protein